MHEGNSPSTRIAAARREKFATLQEACSSLKLRIADLADLECDDDEVIDCVSIGNLCELARRLNVSLPWIVVGRKSARTHSIVDVLSAKLGALDDIKAFESAVGWSVEAFIQDRREVMNWNLRCFIDVCSGLGLRWDDCLDTLCEQDPPERQEGQEE